MQMMAGPSQAAVPPMPAPAPCLTLARVIEELQTLRQVLPGDAPVRAWLLSPGAGVPPMAVLEICGVTGGVDRRSGRLCATLQLRLPHEACAPCAADAAPGGMGAPGGPSRVLADGADGLVGGVLKLQSGGGQEASCEGATPGAAGCNGLEPAAGSAAGRGVQARGMAPETGAAAQGAPEAVVVARGIGAEALGGDAEGKARVIAAGDDTETLGAAASATAANAMAADVLSDSASEGEAHGIAAEALPAVVMTAPVLVEDHPACHEAYPGPHSGAAVGCPWW